MVITGGFNVYPRAVEDVLEAHPGVAAACVFGVPDDHWGEIVVAAVVPRDGGIAVCDLAAYVRARQGPGQTPKRTARSGARRVGKECARAGKGLGGHV